MQKLPKGEDFLPEITVAELESLRSLADDPKKRRRVMAIIEWKEGLSMREIAADPDVAVAPSTVFSWLENVHSKGIEWLDHVPHHPGRPRKSRSNLEELKKHLKRTPLAQGYVSAFWTTALAQRFIQEKYGIEYSPRHLCRLMKEMGFVNRRITSADCYKLCRNVRIPHKLLAEHNINTNFSLAHKTIGSYIGDRKREFSHLSIWIDERKNERISKILEPDSVR